MSPRWLLGSQQAEAKPDVEMQAMSVCKKQDLSLVALVRALLPLPEVRICIRTREAAAACLLLTAAASRLDGHRCS